MSTRSLHLGLIGHPLGHSLSPVIHNAALGALGLRGRYRNYPIPPNRQGKPKLSDILHEMRAGEIHGLNVTIPHKQAVIPFLDRLSPAAAAIGAVNTLFLQEGRLVGDNTDAPGFLADLDDFLRSNKIVENRSKTPPQSALILGAGGSARAIAYALTGRGWVLTFAARRLSQAQALVSSLFPNQGENKLRSIPLTQEALEGALEDISLVVNATPLGAPPHLDASPWPLETPLPADAGVYDLVYNPPDTMLIQRARQAGLAARSGLGMLVEQAALSFERWTGQSAPRQVMLRAAQDRLRELQGHP